MWMAGLQTTSENMFASSRTLEEIFKIIFLRIFVKAVFGGNSVGEVG